MANRPEAVVVVILRAGRFLLIRRGPSVPDAGVWAPMCGKVEAGEAQAAAVVREAREETGLAVEPLRKVWECVSASGTHDLHWWLALPVGGTLKPDQREISATRWCTADEYLALDGTFPCDREFFGRVLPELGDSTWLDSEGGS